ncbi:copper transporter [Suillus fuscotomentosus]|uniref:Copper transport protein n=1 Tax=Suillus fuscotomentosus TaxID=1912939 RepID=A0AAD4E6P8_9AGAM|nr:copper transporter [Suillus fuscotomentosus]KAG1900590.1 copper transporter [Suillus fuscotomentosus]
MDHGAHNMAARCSMHMLWNTQIIDTCVVFSQWHIRSNLQFFFSFLAIVALGMLYEYLRVFSRDFDKRIAVKVRIQNARRTPLTASGRSSSKRHDDDTKKTGLLNGSRVTKKQGFAVPPLYRAMRAVLYGASVGLSFFLMLVFMTYNAYLIFAVILGAGAGHYILGDTIESNGLADKGMTCH